MNAVLNNKYMPQLINTLTEIKVLPKVDDLNNKELDVTLKVHFLSKGDVSNYILSDGTIDQISLKEKFSSFLAKVDEIEI